MKQKELNAPTRARFYAQLAQTERAGLPLRGSLEIISASANNALRPRLEQFHSKLATGADVAQAGLRSGLFLPWEARLLQAAAASGKLGDSFAALSRRYADRARRYARLRNGLVLPCALMIVAVLVAPLPALFQGEISGQMYLLLTAGRLVLFFSALYLLSFSWRRLSASGADNTIFRLLLRVPYFGTLIRRQQQRDFLHTLGLALEAGVPAFEALPLAAESVSHPGLRRRFAAAARQVRHGASVIEALRDGGALPDGDAERLLRAGEVSGRTEEMLHHLVRQLDEQIDGQYQMIADWTPRALYFLVIAFFVTAR